MKIIADTNLLVRAAVRDDLAQAELAMRELSSSNSVAVPLAALCRFVWVLSRAFKRRPAEIAASIRDLIASGNIIVDKPAVEAGLAFLDAGGDFADGVVIHQGAWLGGEEFVSFDKKAIALAKSQGRRARLLS